MPAAAGRGLTWRCEAYSRLSANRVPRSIENYRRNIPLVQCERIFRNAVTGLRSLDGVWPSLAWAALECQLLQHRKTCASYNRDVTSARPARRGAAPQRFVDRGNRRDSSLPGLFLSLRHPRGLPGLSIFRSFPHCLIFVQAMGNILKIWLENILKFC